MTGFDAIDVDVYKTARRPETFLFLPAGLDVAQWPDGLADVFSPTERVMTLTLTREQPLAAQPAQLVMSEIAARGYFLQLPPNVNSDVGSIEALSC